MYRSGGGAACVPPPLETGVGVAQYPHFPSKGLGSPPSPSVRALLCTCVHTHHVRMCLHLQSCTWQPPSSPAGRHRSPSSTGKGTKREIRCLSSALLPQVPALDAGGRSQACCSWAPPPRCLLLGRLRGSWQGQGPGGRFRKRVWKAGRPDCCLPEEWL